MLMNNTVIPDAQDEASIRKETPTASPPPYQGQAHAAPHIQPPGQENTQGPGKPKPPSGRERRVGTFTFGLTLIAAGLGMAAALLFPHWDGSFLLRLSPLVLVSLGVEVLASTRREGRIKYDWLGMLLCLFLLCLGLGLFGLSWGMMHYAEHYFPWC